MDQDFRLIDNAGEYGSADAAIAIVGMSCRFAKVRGLDAYWALLRDAREAIHSFSDEDLIAAGVSPDLLRHPNYVRRGAPLDDMECFDATLFGLSPRDASIMDPQHRHFLECAWEALENAGHTPKAFDGTIGVFAGSGHNAYMPNNLMTNPGLVRDVGPFLLRHTSNDKDFLTTRVSYLFDLKGPSINVQTACSTSLVSIHLAVQSLLSGECDMALAGGASIELPHRQGYLFEEGEILSPDGRCRPFDAGSQGTVFGSGCGVVALRRLEDALAAGDHIYAVVRGSAINNDGAGKVGYLAPSVDGQSKVIAEALAIAGWTSDTIGYVEAHGTGTPVGDPIEVAALTAAFRQSSDRPGACTIGSVKGNIGHTDTAAGAAGVIKVALAMHHRTLPATLNFEAPNPSCAFEGSPFAVQAQTSEWLARGGQTRRAGISSLGVGGTNAHVVLEEAPPRAPGGPGRPRQLLLCSAKTEASAAANAGALAGYLADNPALNLADAAYTLSLGRQHLACRKFAVGEDAPSAAAALVNIAAPARGACLPGRKVSFLFCGAGPQHVDMARGLYQAEPLFRVHVDHALDILARSGGPDVRRWLFPVESDRLEAAGKLERPSIALPAIFIIQTSLARFWMDLGVQPAAMIGHSAGEYAAAHIAGVLDLEAGLRVVSTRGRLFETVGNGAMLSVPLSEAELLPLLPPDLAIATINAPRLCVVSGAADAIGRFHRQLDEREIEAQVVRISVAAHSPMLDPILPEFRALMQTIDLRAPEIPFASNRTGDWVTRDNVTDPEYWVGHLRETVRFTDGLQRLLDDSDTVLLEVGPGRSLASLVRQHPGRDSRQPVLSTLRHADQVVEDDAFVLQTMGELWTLGVEIDWNRYWADEHRLRVPLPTYQFARQRHWIEPGAAGQSLDDHGSLLRHDDVARWQYEPVWKRTGLPGAATHDGVALVLEDDAGLGREIAERLRATGREVVSVRAGRFGRGGRDRFTVEPSSMRDFARLLDCLSAEGRLPGQIYHCWLVTGASTRQARSRRLLDRGLHSLMAMAPELARQLGDEAVEIALVTDRAQRVADERGLIPLKATAIAAAGVIATEYPNLHVRCIDVVLPPAGHHRGFRALGEALVGELAGAGESRAIAYRAGERWVLDHQALPASDRTDPALAAKLRAGGTYVITGGLGGLGLTIARRLAELDGVRLALVARAGLPPREQWPDLLANRAGGDSGVEDKIRKVLALEAAGARVEVVAADVGDARRLRQAIRGVEGRFGAITGVFHAAGTLDDGLLETKSLASVGAVLRPKVAGTLALEQALRRHPAEFLVLFSSISAFAGLAGQADYAAANAFLDSYAQSRQSDPLTQVLSIGWSQWSEVGMAATLNRGSDGAAGLPDDLGEGESVAHPFLERLHRLSGDEHVVAATLTPERHWVLDEHRVANGGPLLPGTGYLELVRAAHTLAHPGLVVLSEVTFLSPFAVADGEAREMRIHLQRRIGGDWRFVVLGRSPNASGWVEHATGLVGTNPAGEDAGSLDHAAIAARCAAADDGLRQPDPAIRFGPRWANVRQLRLGSGEALLDLAVDARFEGDFDTVLLHPALLDFATAGAQQLIAGHVPGSDFFAPFSYRRLVQYAPLPPTIVSHVRYRTPDDTPALIAVFDVTIADPSGRIVAEISEFAMMRVRDPASLSRSGTAERRAQPANATTAALGQLEAITPSEGLQVIDRLLAGPAIPHVIVSPYDLAPALAQLRAPRRAAPRIVRGEDGGGDEDLPITATERVIAELWSELLGVDPVRRTDDFFDLGGHSLLAVQFTNRLRKKTGRTLPLGALLNTPTVAQLAAVIDPEGAAAAASMIEAGSSPPSAVHSNDVVTIRPGGSLTPLFFVHDGLGETLLYRGLALRLDPNRAVYGLEPLRNAAGNYAHTRIAEMAENYIARIRTVQPAGPYLLAGLCAGGVIAFEIARQLQVCGEEVAFLGIIDGADVAAAKRPFYITRSRLSRARASLRGSGSLMLVPDLARKATNALTWEVRSRLEQARDRRAVEHMRAANDGGEPGSAVVEAGLPFLKLYEVAHRVHRPEGLFDGGRLVLFKASDDRAQGDDLPYRAVYSDLALGWGRRAASEVVIVDVPGGHSSALQDPHVETLARLFQEALDDAAGHIGTQDGRHGGDADYGLMAEAAE